MKRVLLAVLLGSVGVSLGCGHEARPVVAPDDHPPVPPASPVGYLVDDAGELQLRDDQLAQLRKIDDELGAKLSTYESELRNGEPVPQSGNPAPPRNDVGVRASGDNQAQPHGPVGDTPISGMDATGIPRVQSRTYVVTGETVTRIRRDRARDTRAAIQRAFTLLDAKQQPIARRVLTDHGVNPDTGEVHEASGVPGAKPDDNPLAPIKQGEP
ncbi:MAG TPA: hypothetical protein VHW23_25970 [Kofleriaceae bacterium]|jgi:hypothetical protein|nr:hypothetical protein [Kofleriaceae bacterium]